MDQSALLAFVAVAIPLGAVPGPDWMFMLSSTTRYRVVLPAASGLAVGHLAIVAAIALGLGPLVTAVPQIMTGLALAGGAYLLYLGVNVLRTASPVAVTGSGAAPVPFRRGRLLRQGLGVTGLNPKAWLFYLVLIPQFVRPTAAWPAPVQMTILGLVFAAACMGSAIALGYLAERLIAPRPRASVWLSRIAGVIMLGLGVALLIEHAPELVGR